MFKLVPEWFPDRVGAVTGVVGAAGGLGGFFPPLVMGIVKSATGGYALGFVLMALVAVACLVVLRAPARAARDGRRIASRGRAARSRRAAPANCAGKGVVRLAWAASLIHAVVEV